MQTCPMKNEVQQDQSITYVIDDDEGLRDGISALLRSVDIAVETFGSTKDFLRSKRPDVPGCLILDVRLPGMSGLEFQTELGKLGIDLPVVFITAHADVPMGIQAMKAGAVEFLCKPFREQDLLDAVRTAISRDAKHREKLTSLMVIRQHHETLTPREQEVMALVVSGMMNKQIAGKLGLSEITVKVHRASIMRKMNAKSLAELVRQADALDGAKSKL
jgi:FixJ family two-component response regulator